MIRCGDCMLWNQRRPATMRWVGRHADEEVAVPAAGECRFPLPFFASGKYTNEDDGKDCRAFIKRGDK